jgi:LmbE family N-acetylglucosaminyl deacetylase
VSKVLVLAPHPDDEAIGCGGTIRHHVLAGDHVTVLYLTSGEKGVHEDDTLPGDYVQDVVSAAAHVREREAGVCSQILGTQRLDFWRETDGGFDPWYDPDKYKAKLHAYLEDVDPQVIYCPNRHEAHVDHSGTHELLRIYSEQYGMRCDYRYYEVWTPLSRPYLTYNDITDVIDVKRSAIRAYKSQLFNAFDEATLALNHYRGLLHGPNKMYCEAFDDGQH